MDYTVGNPFASDEPATENIKNFKKTRAPSAKTLTNAARVNRHPVTWYNLSGSI